MTKIIFAVSTLLFALLFLLVDNSYVHSIDSYVNSLMPALQTPPLDTFFVFITSLFNTKVFLVWILLLFAYLTYKRRWHCLLFLFFGIAGGQEVKTTIKQLTDKARPENPFGLPVHESSFPSGHATTSVFLFLALLYLFTPLVPSRYRLGFQLLCSLGMVLVPLSRLYTQVHYASDVLAGAMLGLASFTFTILVFNYFKNKKVFKHIDNSA